MELILSAKSYKETVFSNALNVVGKNDTVTTIVVHSKLLFIGTSRGRVHVLNLKGRVIFSHRNFPKSIRIISVDSSAQIMAVLARDKKITVSKVSTGDILYNVDFLSVPQAFAVCPSIASSESMVVGLSNKLILRKKRWHGNVEEILHAGENCINCVNWHKSIIIWSTKDGFDVYNMELKTWISHIPISNGKVDEFIDVPSIYWDNDSTFVVVTRNILLVCNLKLRDSSKSKQKNCYVEICNSFTFPTSIAGVAKYEDKLLCFFCEGPVCFDDSYNCTARISGVVPLSKKEFKVIKEEKFTINIKDTSLCKSLAFGFISSDCLMIVASDTDMVIVKMLNADETLSSLIELGHYMRALNFATSNINSIKSKSVIDDLKIKVINQLLISNDTEDIQKCCEILETEPAETWKMILDQFRQHNKLQLIIKYLPDEIPISKEDFNKIFIYLIENILNGCMEALMEAIEKYLPRECFDLDLVSSRLHKFFDEHALKISATSQEEIGLILGQIYHRSGQPEKAFMAYLVAKNSFCFHILRENPDMIRSDFLLRHLDVLLKIDQKMLSYLLTTHRFNIELSVFIKSLHILDDVFLCRYLKTLYDINEDVVNRYSDIYVNLLVKYDTEELLNYLKNSKSYDIQKIITLCENEQKDAALVYLYEKTGNYEKMIDILMDQFGGLEQAIIMAKKVEEDEVWNRLFHHCANDPDKIQKLINTVKYSINIENLIAKIPQGIVIPGLNTALVSILKEYSSRILTHKSFSKLVELDNVSHFRNDVHLNCEGISVQPANKCLLCRKNVLKELKTTKSIFIVFFCGHIYHTQCIKSIKSSVPKKDQSKCPQCIYGNLSLYI